MGGCVICKGVGLNNLIIFIIMRLLKCGGFCHRKNEEGMRLMTSAVGAEYVETNDSTRYSEDWDLVFIPSGYIGPENFPNARRIIYGPHNFVFPEGDWLQKNFLNDKRIYYNSLSKWVTSLYSETSGVERYMNMVVLPFAVDVERFKPAGSKVYERDCFIYFKARDPSHLEHVERLCSSKGLSYTVISYGSYNEEHYRDILNTSRFGIWIGCHESQGFGLQEALAMNVPLVVWDARSMFYEMNGGRKQYGHLEGRYKLESTSATTWDDTCGIIANESTIGDCIGRMAVDYGKYGGREWIVRELGAEACMGRWLDEKINSNMKILFICPYYNNSHFLSIQVNSFKKYLKNCEWKILVIDDSENNTINTYSQKRENIFEECNKYNEYVYYLKYPYAHNTRDVPTKHRQILNFIVGELSNKYKNEYDYIASFDADMCLINNFDAKKELEGFDIIGPKRIQSLGNYQLAPDVPLLTYFWVHCCFFNIKTITNLHTMSMDNIPNTTTDTGGRMIEFMFNNPQYKYKFLGFNSGHERLPSLNGFEFFYNNTFIHFMSGSLWLSERNCNYIEDINKFNYLILNGLNKHDEEIIESDTNKIYKIHYHKFFSQRSVNKDDLQRVGLNIF